MPLTDSRLGPGTLTFGATPFDVSAQVSKCSIIPDVSETDGTPTLSDPEPASEMTTKWKLEGDTISDWGSGSGFVLWALDHAGTDVAFSFVPSTSVGMEFSGTVSVRPIEIGGDVNTQSVVKFSFPIVGDPTYAA